MEGRTKINYGTNNGLIAIKDLDYMLSIIDSDLNEEEKAIRLYLFCNESSLINNKNLYNTLELEETKKLEKLIMIYKKYESRGLFKNAKNPYKCTIEEIVIRLNKINSVFEIMNSVDTDYKKTEQLLTLFKSAEEFRKTYSLFIKYGKKDTKLNMARKAIDNFDCLYNKFKEYETRGIVENVAYAMTVKDYLQNYKYAKFVLEHYIESVESYKESEFLLELGLDKDTFDFCAQTIEELGLDLYNKFLKKKEINNKIRCIKNKQTIADLANGINTGILSDGTKFELLEFIKRIPFKKNNNFKNTLVDFMKRNNPSDINTIVNYIYDNKLVLPSAFAPLDLKSIYEPKTTINGIEITNADNDIIIAYLKVNDIPLTSKTYLISRAKYLNGEIDIEMVNQQHQIYKTSKSRVLIP